MTTIFVHIMNQATESWSADHVDYKDVTSVLNPSWCLAWWWEFW